MISSDHHDLSTACLWGAVFFCVSSLMLPPMSVAQNRAAVDAEKAESGVATLSPTERLESITNRLTSHEYDLRYKFRPGQTLTYDVVHLVTIDTTVQGVSQENHSRSKSTKSWTVASETADGQITFTHSILNVDMWSETTGRQAIRYNSRQDDKPPAEYEHVAEKLGKPLSTVTINPFGKIVKRDDDQQQINLGTGGLMVPLPGRPVKVGQKWAEQSAVRVRLEDGQVKLIKTQQMYQLKKVETGMATISMATQILTPVTDPRVESQLVQRLSKGEIKFDVDQGRVVSKQLDWQQQIISFNGPESNMKYLARLKEELVTPARTAAKP